MNNRNEKILLEDLKKPEVKDYVLSELELIEKEKDNERRYPDRTFSNSVDTGVEIVVARMDEYAHNALRRPILPLISFRWTQARTWLSKGAQVVLTRQPETSDESFELAKKLVQEMRDELKTKESRFFGRPLSFREWRDEKTKKLILAGFYRKSELR